MMELMDRPAMILEGITDSYPADADAEDYGEQWETYSQAVLDGFAALQAAGAAQIDSRASVERDAAKWIRVIYALHVTGRHYARLVRHDKHATDPEWDLLFLATRWVEQNMHALHVFTTDPDTGEVEHEVVESGYERPEATNDEEEE